MFADGLQYLAIVTFVVAVVLTLPGDDRTFIQRQLAVQDQVRVKLLERAQTVTGGTSAMWAVKAKGAWFDLAQAGAALDTREMFAVGALLRIVPVCDVGDTHHALAQAQRRLDRITEAAHIGASPCFIRIGLAVAHNNAIHDGFDGVHLITIQIGHFRYFVELTVDADAHKTLLLQILKNRLVMALAIFDHGGQDQQARAF